METTQILLSEEEIKVIEQQLRGEIEEWTATPYQQKILTKVIRDAENLMHKLGAYEESGDDLIAWYYNKYKEQQAVEQ